MEEKKEVSTEKIPGGEKVTEKTSSSPVSQENKGTFQAYYLVYYILGVLEILFAFRLVFKLLGANPNSGFVSFIYSITGGLLAPFLGIFHTTVSQGVETTSVLEPATIIGMIVYALVGWGITKLIVLMLAGKE